MTAAETLEYRVAHLRERLAREEVAELGVQVEVRAGGVHLTGTVPTSNCRDLIVRVAREEMPDLPVTSDLVIADASAPDHAEELA